MAHLTLTDRIQIEMGLNADYSLSEIAKEIEKNRSTVLREVMKHISVSDAFPPCRTKNRCIHRFDCHFSGLCEDKPNCTRKCSVCHKCNSVCKDYEEEVCSLLSKSPYVCNGCKQKNSCTLIKHFYSAKKAQEEYQSTLSSAREGCNMTTLELRNVDEIVSPLLKQGQSIHHIYIHNQCSLSVCESTISRLIKNGMLTGTVLDQRRVVKLKPRKTKAVCKKIDRKCRIGRTFEDFQTFKENNCDIQEVQMDTVIGAVGGKCLFTLFFTKSELMLAFLCTKNNAASIQSCIDQLYHALEDDFKVLFPVILTDNGSEFSNPKAIEETSEGLPRTKVFYCDPMASWQKPDIERNHEYIRYILPKGTSFDNLTQEKVGLIMSHINSYSRESLGDKSPFEVFEFMYGKETLDKLLHLLCQRKISPSEIVLKPSLLKQ